MAARTGWRALLSAALTAATLGLPWAPGPEQSRRPLPAPVRQKLAAAAHRPHHAPDLAFEFARFKRLSGAAGIDPARAYERALEQVRRMPRYSTRSGGFMKAVRSGDAPAVAAGRWTPLGPGNIGGRTRALVIRPDKPRVIYAAGVSGGVWKSRNGGRSWRPVGDRLANLAVNALALDPSDPRVLYAGTGEGYFREVVRGTGLPLRGGGIFRSEDGGESWERLPGTEKKRFQWVNDLAVSPPDPDRLYAATRKGVYRSLDRGQSWKRVLSPRTRGGCLDLVLRSGRTGDDLLVSCGTLRQASVYRNRSAEGEGGWERVLSEPGMGRTSLAVAPSDQQIVYALSASNVPGPGGRFEQALHAVFRSDEGGAAGSWEARVRNSDPRKGNTVLLSNPVLAYLGDCLFDERNVFFGMGWYVNVIAVDPQDPDRVWAGGVDLFRSDDGGRNWDPATYWWSEPGFADFVHADHHGLVFHPRRSATLYSLNDGGIYRTDNARAALSSGDLAICRPGSSGVAWTSLNRGYGVTQFYHGTPFQDGDRYLGGTQDNGTVLGSDAAGPNRWIAILGGDGGYSAVDPRDPEVVYATIQNGMVFKSIDGGRSFAEAVSGIADLAADDLATFRGTRPGFLFIAPLVLDPGDPDRLWNGGSRLWRSDDGAASWSAASAPLREGGKASAIAVAPGNPDRVLAGAHDGWVHRSDAAGAAAGATEWDAVRPRRGFVSSLTFAPGDSATAYATYAGFGGRHVWRSRDGGASWEAIDGAGETGIPDIPVHDLVVDPGDPLRLYAGTDLGVFVSLDGGGSWAVENTGFAAAVTESLSLVARPGGETLLFAFTHGRGAWRVQL